MRITGKCTGFFRVRWGTLFWIAIFLTEILGASVAFASPETLFVNFELAPELSAQGFFEEPIGRWLTELCAMARISIDCARWPTGESASVRLTMGKARAFECALAREGQLWTISSDLLREPLRVDPICGLPEIAEALGDFAFRLPVKSPARVRRAFDGQTVADALAEIARWLRARGALCRAQAAASCAGCGECAVCELCALCEGFAQFAQAFEDCFLRSPRAAALTVVRTIRPERAAAPAVFATRTAGDLIIPDLLLRAFRAFAYAVAQNA